MSIENSKYAEWLAELEKDYLPRRRGKERIDEIKNKTRAERTSDMIDFVKSIAREALEKEFFSEGTNPYKSDFVYNSCGPYCRAIFEGVKNLPQIEELQRCVSGGHENPRQAPHEYLIIFLVEEEPILIDPTLGQYVEGYDDLFVGTRDELKKIIMDKNTKIIHTSRLEEDTPKNRENFFNHVWGNESVVIESSEVKKIDEDEEE